MRHSQGTAIIVSIYYRQRTIQNTKQSIKQQEQKKRCYLETGLCTKHHLRRYQIFTSLCSHHKSLRSCCKLRTVQNRKHLRHKCAMCFNWEQKEKLIKVQKWEVLNKVQTSVDRNKLFFFNIHSLAHIWRHNIELISQSTAQSISSNFTVQTKKVHFI